MSSIAELSFIQKSYDLKQDILLKLYDYYIEDPSLHIKNSSKRTFKLAQRGRTEFEERFPIELPKEEYVGNGISKHLYSLESGTGISFFFSVKTLDYIKNLFKKTDDNGVAALDQKRIIKVYPKK